MDRQSIQLLNEREAAALLSTSPRTLQGWRQRGEGPAFVKLGRGVRARVRYRLGELEAWVAASRRTFPAEGASK